MLRYRVKTPVELKRLRTDKDRVMSIEYVIFAACVVTKVGAAFNAGVRSIKVALTDAMTTIGATVVAG